MSQVSLFWLQYYQDISKISGLIWFYKVFKIYQSGVKIQTYRLENVKMYNLHFKQISISSLKIWKKLINFKRRWKFDGTSVFSAIQTSVCGLIIRKNEVLLWKISVLLRICFSSQLNNQQSTISSWERAWISTFLKICAYSSCCSNIF